MYRNEHIDPETFAEVCVGIAEYYNNAAMMVENNDIGFMVCEKITKKIIFFLFVLSKSVSRKILVIIALTGITELSKKGV